MTAKGMILPALALAALGAAAPTALAPPTLTPFPSGLPDGGRPTGVTAGPGGLWVAGRTPARVARLDAAGTPSLLVDLPTAGTRLVGIAAGADGRVWVAGADKHGDGLIASVAPGGEVTELTAGIGDGADPAAIAAGPDGAMWFTEAGRGAIGRIGPAGEVSEHPAAASPSSSPRGIAAGPDGNLWFTDAGGPSAIGRMTPSGTVTRFTAGLTGAGRPEGITAGPDGAVWFTQPDGDRVGRITAAGTVTTFSAGITPASKPTAITSGADGSLWFTEAGMPGRVGRITTEGAVSEYPLPGPGWDPAAIATGPDGNIWVAAGADPGRLVRVSVPPGVGTPTLAGGTLSAPVRPNSQPTEVVFEYGRDATLGQRTPAAGLDAVAGPVVARAGAALPAGVAWVRARATNASGTTWGPLVAVDTKGGAGEIAPTPFGPGRSAPGEVPPPVIGRRLVGGPESGRVRVRLPGRRGYVTLTGAAALPVGTVVDTRAGRLRIVSAVPGGTQDGRFWGGVFLVRQTRDGMTDLLLRGRPACTAPRVRAGAADKARRRPARPRPPVLWGEDDGGRFRTHGRTSVAVVRGTRWVTVERCDGTLTRVVRGAVLVRERRTGRRVLVRAGRSHLARASG